MRSVPVTLVPGRQVASGFNSACRYPGGSIRLQREAFLKAGVDIGACYPGTLNFATSDEKILFPHAPSHEFAAEWFPGKFETFRVAPLSVVMNGATTPAFLYQPSLIRESGPKPAPRYIEVLAPAISGIQYGATAELIYDEKQCSLITGEQAIEYMRQAQGARGFPIYLSQEAACARLLEIAAIKVRVALALPDSIPFLDGDGAPFLLEGTVKANALALAVADLTLKDRAAAPNTVLLAQRLMALVSATA